MAICRLITVSTAIGLMLASFSVNAAATDVKIGGVGIVKPTYEGSDSYEVVGAPFAFPVFSSTSNGTVTFNGADDVRFRLLQEQGFEAGPLAGYAFGREDGDGPLLRGLGDIDGGVIVGGYVGYRLSSLFFDVSYHHIVSGDTGGFFRLGVSNKYRINEQFSTKIRVGATYADDDYMSDYFGVSAAQSASSTASLAPYDTSAGFKDVHVKLSGTYDIDNRWSLTGSAGYKRLIGDAADSPVVESEDQFSASLGVTYRFSFRR